jgi:hypothetical protein
MNMQEMTARMETNQAKLGADRNADREQIKRKIRADREEQKAERKAEREDLKEMTEEMMNVNLKERDQIWTRGNEMHSQCLYSGHEGGGSKIDNVLPSNDGGVSGQ